MHASIYNVIHSRNSRKKLFLWVLRYSFFSCFHSFALADTKQHSFGWYYWPPYQTSSVGGQVSGLDIELVNAIAERSNISLTFEQRSWPEQLAMIKRGEQDFTVGFKTPDRMNHVYFSQAIRTETNVLYMRRGESKATSFHSIESLLQLIDQGFRLGGVANYAYGPQAMRQYLQSTPENRIVFSQSDEENFQKLFNGEIDGFLTDRTVAANLAWQHGWQSLVEEHPDYFAQEAVYIMASQKSVSQSEVEQLDQALSELKATGEYDQIVQSYLTPVLLSMTLSQSWFTVLDIIGTIAFAISGLVLARKGDYSIFGALILASLPAVGGGIVRDLLVDREPIGALRSPLYMVLILSTVVGGYLLFRLIDTLKPHKQARLVGVVAPTVEFFDAVGLAAFTVVGVVVALEAQLQPLWLWGPLLAALTGAGGGIMRDVVRADVDNPALKKSFYAEVALIWGFILSLVLTWETRLLSPDLIFYTVVLTVIGAITMRLLIIKFKISSPRF